MSAVNSTSRFALGFISEEEQLISVQISTPIGEIFIKP